MFQCEGASSFIGGAGKIQCQRLAVYAAKSICVHEHLKESNVCELHANEEGISGGGYLVCSICLDLGHPCRVEVFEKIPIEIYSTRRSNDQPQAQPAPAPQSLQVHR